MSFTHEDFGREVHGNGPSDRAFGLVFAAALLFFSLAPLRHGKSPRIWCLALGGATVLVAAMRPSLLHGMNLIWTRIGKLLGKVMNPIVMALLFYSVFTPAAIILRWMGRDLLGISLEPAAKTYWIQCDTSEGLASMKNQF